MGVFPVPIMIAVLSLATSAGAATIGIVAPQSGPFAILGQQLSLGAKSALTSSGHEIVEIDESCEPGSGTGIAEALVNAKAQVAIGFLCSESLTGGIELLAPNNIAALTLSSRATGLAEDAQKYGWPLYRLAPALSDEARASVDAIIAHWKGAPLALIEDGTIYSRELVDAIRLEIENLGLKPLLVDTLRPGQENQLALVRRLARAGASHAFIAADRNDVAIIARDANENGISLKVMSGEAMKAANTPVPTPAGVLAVVEPDYRLAETSSQAVAAIEATGAIVEGYVLPAYAAAQIAASAVTRSAAEQTSTTELLSTNSFETILGPIRFNDQKGLSENPIRLQEWNGQAFVDPTAP
jgi:branched-chain amino acid transport system substrate-binding protein